MRDGRPDWVKAFEVQMRLWDHVAHIDTEAFIQDRLGLGRFDEAEALRQATNACYRTLLLADPFFVTEEMCDLVETAVATFKPEPLRLSDFLSPCGFLYFEKPIEVLSGELGDQVWLPYVAFTWIGIERDRGTGAFMAALVTFLGGPWAPDGLPHIYELEAWKLEAAPPPKREGWMRLIQATLRLMLEFKPARRQSQRADRATRRAARRLGFPEREVTVVQLRRERAVNEHLGGTANYSCRFMVSGHWRNQWCPSLNAHRQTWIAPYVKGPSDKPFKPRAGRAFTFSR